MFLSDDTWYITRDIFGEEGEIRSLQKEVVLVPQLGWEFNEQSDFDNNWKTDNTLKVTHHNLDKKEIRIALKLLGIMSSSLLLIGLMVTWLGRSTSKK